MKKSDIEHMENVGIKMMNDETCKLYKLFKDVFGEVSANHMPFSADGIDDYLFHEMKYCGKQVDACKIADIISLIHSLRNAERILHCIDSIPDEFE